MSSWLPVCLLASALIVRATKKKIWHLSPLLKENQPNYPIRRPTKKSITSFSNIKTISDLRRLASSLKSPLPALLPREFIPSERTDDGAIRILQFNILARGLSSPPNNGGFILSPVASLHFEHYRKYRLLEEILRFHPDIVTLEELDQYDDFFQPLMNKFGYDSIFQPKLDAPTLGIWTEIMTEKDRLGQIPYNSDGSAIFWKRSGFEGVQSRSLNYSSKDGTPHTQVGVVARLLNKKNGLTFLVACTHLKSKPPHEAKRVQQITQFMDYVFAMQTSKDEPIVLTGDFNADPNNDVHTAASARLTSAYQQLLGSEPAYTTCKVRKKGEACHTIDYIFLSNGAQVTSCLSIPEYSTLPTERIPTWSYPSDHLSIGADVLLWPTTTARIATSSCNDRNLN